MLNTILITLASLALAGVIISPFFWLRFLKAKSVGKYLVVSSVVTLIFLFAYIYPVDNFLSDWTAKTNADLYYFYYDVSLNPILLVVMLIVVSPLIFTKIIKNKFTLRDFLAAFVLSVAIFAAIFVFWALVLLPQAFSQLHNYF
jgi:hypothetical protein